MVFVKFTTCIWFALFVWCAGCDSPSEEPEYPESEQTTGEEVEEELDEAADETEDAVDEAEDEMDEEL